MSNNLFFAKEWWFPKAALYILAQQAFYIIVLSFSNLYLMIWKWYGKDNKIKLRAPLWGQETGWNNLFPLVGPRFVSPTHPSSIQQHFCKHQKVTSLVEQAPCKRGQIETARVTFSFFLTCLCGAAGLLHHLERSKPHLLLVSNTWSIQSFPICWQRFMNYW